MGYMKALDKSNLHELADLSDKFLEESFIMILSTQEDMAFADFVTDIQRQTNHNSYHQYVTATAGLTCACGSEAYKDIRTLIEWGVFKQHEFENATVYLFESQKEMYLFLALSFGT